MKQNTEKVTEEPEQSEVHPLTYQGDPGFEYECEDATEEGCFMPG
jgi:hypothetical protein